MPDEGQLITPLTDALEAIPAPTSNERRNVEGVVIATLVALRAGAALIHYPELDEDFNVLASSARPLAKEDIGAQLAVVFVGGDPDMPLVIGKLEQPLLPAVVERKRKRELVLEAEHRVTIRCGRSSITLSRDGRLELRGQHLLSRAASVNRIRGGVIQLN